MALASVLLLSLLLNLVPFWWGLPSWGSWAFDEIEPKHVVQEHRWPDRYPLVHHDVLIPVFAVAGAVAEARGLEGMSLVSLQHAAGRLFRVLLALATVYLVYRYGREIYGRRSEGSRVAATFAALVIATVPSFVY